MTQWYVKDLSNLTQVSVQALHHYDRIALLKPSIRLTNGYRVYSEKDLLKLQQIIALKFFGFELSQIKLLLSEEVGMVEHFSAQSKLLEQKAKNLLEANEALKRIISDCSQGKSISWETIIKSIEVYRMTQQLENAWAGKVLNHEELKQLFNFEQKLKNQFTLGDKEAFEKGWRDLVDDVNHHLKQDPESKAGRMLGERCMEWVNSLYGKEYAGLRSAIWVKGFKEGHVGEEHGLSYDAVLWLDKAMDAYCKDRVENLLKQIETHPHQTVLKKWEEMLVDFCGDDVKLKADFLKSIIEDNSISKIAKEWIQKKL